MQKTFFFLVLGLPTFGERRGSTWLGQNPKFFQKSRMKAPLKVSFPCEGQSTLLLPCNFNSCIICVTLDSSLVPKSAFKSYGAFKANILHRKYLRQHNSPRTKYGFNSKHFQEHKSFGAFEANIFTELVTCFGHIFVLDLC